MQERLENSIQCIWLFDPVLCNSTNWTNVLLIFGEWKLGTYLIYFRHFLIFHNAFFFYFYSMHYSCSILGWLLVKKRVIHAFNAYALPNWFKSVKQMSALLNVNFWASQTMSQVIKTKRKRKIFSVEQILVPNKRSRLLLWLEVWLEFLKKFVDPLTKLRLEKLKNKKEIMQQNETTFSLVHIYFLTFPACF